METFEAHYESMMKAIRRYAPNTDLEKVERAVRFAQEKTPSAAPSCTTASRTPPPLSVTFPSSSARPLPSWSRA